MSSRLFVHLYEGRIVKMFEFAEPAEVVKDWFRTEINDCNLANEAGFLIESDESFACIYPEFISYWEVIIVPEDL